MLCAVARARYRPPLAAGRALGLGGEVRGSWRAGSRSASSCCRRTSCLFLLHAYFACMLVYFSCMSISPNMHTVLFKFLFLYYTPGKAPGGAEVGVITESAVKRQQTDAVVHENTRQKHTTDERRLVTHR